ncbi:MAG: proton-conducting transporter membrane subunit, partial [Clostridia bacterium]|nr:proton-conducting transporter membrane subunit [Clostridia bacterium]
MALAFVAIAFIASVAMLPGAMANAPVSVKVSLPLGFSFGFLADSLAVFMAMASSLLGTIIVFYSIGYIAHYENQNEYYMIVVMFLGAMMGLVYSTNLLFIYLFWEISAIACWRLIGFFREKYIIRRADKAFLITVGGALVMLIGFIMIYNQTGTFDLTEMDSPVISNIAMLFILFGILSKSATLPFHSWLADAGVAPSPVTSLLHAAVLVKIGVYVFARIFLVTISYDPIWYTIIPIIAAVSALVSAGVALVETDLKRIIAYST